MRASLSPQGATSLRCGPRELLQMRRTVRLSSSMAGLPPLTKEQESFQVQELLLHRSQPQVTKCDLDSPEFATKGGQFERQVVVELKAEEGVNVRYTIERVDAASTEVPTASGSSGMKHPTARSPLYRKPFVLDQVGAYVVRAVAFKESGLLQQKSLTASERFVVLPGASGTLLRNLPSQMVQGVLTIATGSERLITAGLGSIKASIAQATNVVQSAIHLKVGKDQGKMNVAFSIEVDQSRSAQQMVARLTDPSLVTSVAQALDIDASAVAVEADAKALEEVLLSLSWTFPRRSNYAADASRPNVDYLDGSCLLYAEEKLLEVVDYRGPQSEHGEEVSSAEGWCAGSGAGATIVHSGDVIYETGGNHALRVRLSELPAQATDCIFTLSAYHSRDLSRFVAPSMRIFNADCPEHLLSAYSVADAGSASAVVVCSLTREGSVWSVRAHCRTSDGTVRDYTPIEAAISIVQERYARQRRRFPVLRFYSLWQADRALPCGLAADQEVEDVLLPLMDLNADILRNIVEFL